MIICRSQPSKSKLDFPKAFRRDVTDSESVQHEYEQTPFKQMDYEEIIKIIKENEKIQRRIVNDPDLRDKLYEKFNYIRHSGSDQTLPHSFYSSKFEERRTVANTDKFRTPLKDYEGTVLATQSVEDKDGGARFTQFSKSEFCKRISNIPI